MGGRGANAWRAFVIYNLRYIPSTFASGVVQVLLDRLADLVAVRS